MKPSEIREKPTPELEKLAGQLKDEVFRLRFRKGAGQLAQTASVCSARRDLARVLTELRARELGEVRKGAASA